MLDHSWRLENHGTLVLLPYRKSVSKLKRLAMPMDSRKD